MKIRSNNRMLIETVIKYNFFIAIKRIFLYNYLNKFCKGEETFEE